MSNTIRRVDYFNTTVKDQPGQAYQILEKMADLGINLLALTVIPIGPNSTQMTIFPENSLELPPIAEKAGLTLDGPHPAILVQGDDKVGALAEIHSRLYQSGVNVYASSGVSDGKGNYGYVIYVRPETYKNATEALNI